MQNKLDKVLDILNMFEFFYGQRAGRELWADKPIEVQNQDITDFVNNIKYIKDFLNESIILSKDEYELLTDIKALQLQVQDSLNNMSSEDIETIEKQAKKDATEKLYTTIVYRILALNFETDNKDYDKGFFDAQKEILRRVDAVAKEQGVKIKE